MLWIGLLCCAAGAGCKKSAPGGSETTARTAMPATGSAAGAVDAAPSGTAGPAVAGASERKPVAHGLPYQLSLKDGVFGFCDAGGPQQMDVGTGKQTAGTQTCRADHEQQQSRCDDTMQIFGDPEGGKDHLSINHNEFVLEGHSRDCDRDGTTVIVAAGAAVEVIDGAADKIAIVERKGGDKVVIGGGWVAWHRLDEKDPLRLETVSKALEHARTPAQ